MFSFDKIHTRPRPLTLGLAFAAWCVMLVSFASREPAPGAAELAGGAGDSTTGYEGGCGFSRLAATQVGEAEQAAFAPGPRDLALVAGVAEAYRASTGLAPGGVWPALAHGVDWTALTQVVDEVARRSERQAAPPSGQYIRSVYIGDLPPDDIGAIAERIRQQERARRDSSAAP